MTAQSLSLPSAAAAANLRPFDLRRDLLAVADLVEQCFEHSLDADGRLYIQQMRQTARGQTMFKLASGGFSGGIPMGGFVWLEDGRLVGNLSVIEHRMDQGLFLLIANVAVHPDFRRRGIAHQLTRAAIERAQRQGIEQIWLQVDQDNAAAIKLYDEMGFQEQARRTSWRALPGQARDSLAASPDIRVGSRRSRHWAQERDWLQVLYPERVRWNLPFYEGLLDPGWRGTWQRMFIDRQVEQWAATRQGELLGTLAWQSSSLSADRLWLACPSQPDPEAIQTLMAHASARLKPRREVALNFPADVGDDALTASGFRAQRTLLWMRLVK